MNRVGFHYVWISMNKQRVPWAVMGMVIPIPRGRRFTRHLPLSSPEQSIRAFVPPRAALT